MRAILAIGICVLLAGCSEKARLSSQCEAVLKDSLKAPSTYQRIDIKTVKRNFTNDEIKAGNPPYAYGVFIEYDADNSFGAHLRGYAMCNDILIRQHKGESVTLFPFDDRAEYITAQALVALHSE